LKVSLREARGNPYDPQTATRQNEKFYSRPKVFLSASQVAELPAVSAVDLLEAYRTTRFIAYDDGTPVTARIGEHAPEIDALFHRRGASAGAFITA